MTRTPRRLGGVNTAWYAFLVSVLVLAGLVVLLVWDRNPLDKEPIVVWCAAGIKGPVEEAAREYEKLYGVPVRLDYGGSETLLGKIEVSRTGDLFIPADDSYIEKARHKGLVEEEVALAHMTPVLAVRKGNPLGLQSLQDLIDHKRVKFAQANPDAAAVGHLTRQALNRTPHRTVSAVGGSALAWLVKERLEPKTPWAALSEKVLVSKLTVNEVGNAIAIGSVDAGIVWDATVAQYMGELEAVELAELKGVQANVTVGLLKSSQRPGAAMRFARFLSARDRGLPLFEKHGFRTVAPADPWDDGEPTVVVYAGAMLEPAIEKTIKQFARREGLPEKNVKVVYNGCGILVGQMKTGRKPDAFFACEAGFMGQVKDLFLDQEVVSTNQLVILVHKGNPKKIETLKDLAKPGLRVGVGHEQQCAMGVLTQETLRQDGTLDPVMKNVVVRTPTGDMLVNQMVGAPSSLDAVVAYVSNGWKAGDKLEARAIDIPCAIAAQPVAMGKETQHPRLMGRFLKALKSETSRQRFESSGFQWKAAAP